MKKPIIKMANQINTPIVVIVRPLRFRNSDQDRRIRATAAGPAQSLNIMELHLQPRCQGRVDQLLR